MKLTLRAAARMRSAIEKAITSRLSARMNVSIYAPDPMAEVVEAGKKLVADIVIRKRLVSILYKIREAVGAANAASINYWITEQAHVTALSKELADLITSVGSGAKVYTLLPRIEAIKARADEYGPDSVPAALLSDEMIQQLESEQLDLRRRLVEISDKLLELNAKTEIDVPDEDVEFLKEQGII